MSSISDLIFDNNSTLFEVLDELDVPKLALEVKDVSDALNDSLEQVRQLSVVVDKNQVANNTKFVDINTRLDDLDTAVADTVKNADDALKRAKTLETYTQENFMRIDRNFATLDKRVTDENAAIVETIKNLSGGVDGFEERVAKNEKDIQGLFEYTGLLDDAIIKNELLIFNNTADLQRLEAKVELLETSIDVIKANVNSVSDKVAIIEAKFASIPITLEQLYITGGHLVPGARYFVVTQDRNSYVGRTLILDVPDPYRSIRMGVLYSGTINGVRYAQIQFTDGVTTEIGASYSPQDGMVPVGGPIRWRFRTGTSGTFTSEEIRITTTYLQRL